ncbi:MAG: hypothetical protein KDE58_12220 [Caldilineaceae bacterium]|nr:hypothetical protein [Caldilineaceae bacterium]
MARNGFADGAHARWRTLHELTTIAQFVKLHGNQLAQRYLDYSAVIDNDSHKSYEQHYEKLGYAAPNIEDVQKVREAYNNVIQKYGKEFGKNYGWAAVALNDKSPNFSKIEQAVDVSHMRPFYKLANMNVHADSKSISFRLGLPPNVAQILVVGRSMFGLAEPIQNAAYSINNLTGALLLLEPNIDRLAAIIATTQFVDELFMMVHKMGQELEPSLLRSV